MCRISVICPVYNMAGCLEGAISSILNQDFTDFELILVNDGSKDASSDICHAYERCDPRVRVVDKANGGASSARNAGLDVATGEFVTFFDSDDRVESSWLSSFAEAISDDTDLIITSFYKKSKGEETLRRIDGEGSATDILCRLEKAMDSGYIWCKCWRNSVISNDRIRFDTRFAFEEDTLFLYSFVAASRQIKSDKGIRYIDRASYHYDMPDLEAKYGFNFDCQVAIVSKVFSILTELPSLVYVVRNYERRLLHQLHRYYRRTSPAEARARLVEFCNLCKSYSIYPDFIVFLLYRKPFMPILHECLKLYYSKRV